MKSYQIILFFKHAVISLFIITLITNCENKNAEKNSDSQQYAQPDYTLLAKDTIPSIIHLTDITKPAGINFKHENGSSGFKWMPETVGSGVGFFDYNNDGNSDLFLVNSGYWPGYEKSGRPGQKLYQNLGNNKFRDVTIDLKLDISLYGMGCSFADFDADGDMDIYITAVGTNKLLRNDNSRFTDVTNTMGVTGNNNTSETPAWSTGSAWLDIDQDGWLDLFVCNYVKWTPQDDLFMTLDGKTKTYATPDIYQGESCRLYHNIRGGKFEDITKTSGIYNPEGKSLGVAVADFNNDNRPDLVITNDTQPNFLYINNGDGTFIEKGLQAGIAYDEFGRARAGMGVDITDISNTGNQSIAIGNFTREPISLYTTINPSTFQDFSGRAGLSRPSLMSLTFGLLFIDMDLNGFADMVVTNGHIEPDINRIQQGITFRQPSQLFYNKGNGTFIDISKQVGHAFTEPVVGRGLAAADIDNDGDFDLAISENNGYARLFRNDLLATENHWVQFILKGRAPNLNAIGAKITVWAGSNRQTKMIRTGSSYLSQSDISKTIFGIGQNVQIDSVMVYWPTSGKTNLFGSAEADKIYTINEMKPELALK